LTILEDPFRASLCTLEESLLDDFDFEVDLEVDEVGLDVDEVGLEVEEVGLEVDEAALEVDEVGLDDLVVLGSDIFGGVMAINGYVELEGWFVYEDAVDEATRSETVE
jgi:hypothetical protein